MYIVSACRPDRRWLATTAFHSELALFLTDTDSVRSTPSTVPHPSPQQKAQLPLAGFLYASNNSHDVVLLEKLLLLSTTYPFSMHY